MIYFRVHVSFQNSHKNLKPACEYVVEWLNRNGFNALLTDSSDFFEVSVNDETEREKVKEKLEIFLLAVSIRNSMGFVIFDVSENPKYSSWLSVPPSTLFSNNFIKACEQPGFKVTAEKIRDFHMQLESRSKVIYGCSLLEELFMTNSVHILNEDEIKYFIDIINRSNLIQVKKDKMLTALKNRDWMATETRGERMAIVISEYLNVKEEETRDRIKTIYKARNVNAHNTGGSEIPDAIRSIEFILEMYLLKKYGFARMTGELLNFKN